MIQIVLRHFPGAAGTDLCIENGGGALDLRQHIAVVAEGERSPEAGQYAGILPEHPLFQEGILFCLGKFRESWNKIDGMIP